jgi:predicted Zn-dependent peptidase
VIEAVVLSYGASVWMAPSSHVPMVTVRIEYPYDPNTVADGVPHLTEHLLFETTQHFENGDVDRLIRQAGGHSTAWTTWNSLVIETSVSSNNLDVLLAIERDRSTTLCAGLSEENLENQRQVIAGEMLRQSMVKDGRLADGLRKRAFADDPILSKEVMGLIYDLELASILDVCSFSKQWIHPSNARWFVSGDIDPTQFVDALEETFTDWNPVQYTRLDSAPIEMTPKRWFHQDTSNRLFLIWPAPSNLVEQQQAQLVLDALEMAQKMSQLSNISSLHPWYESHLGVGWMGIEVHTSDVDSALRHLELWLEEPSMDLLVNASKRQQVALQKRWLTNLGRVQVLQSCAGEPFVPSHCLNSSSSISSTFTATWFDISKSSMLWMGDDNQIVGEAW